MASTYSNLKIQLMATGENSGTWGNVTNVNLGTAIEEAIAGSADVSFSSANVTLTLTDTNASQTARNMRLNLTGTTGGARDLIVPAIEKMYVVNNGCADAVTVKVSGQTGVAVPAGKTILLYNNGTDVVSAVTHLTSLTLGSALPIASGGTGSTSNTYANLQSNVSGVLPVANGGTGSNTATFSGANITALNASNISAGTLAVAHGGTGAATITANNVILGNGTSAVQVVAPGSSGNILTSNGTTWTSAAPASAGLPGPRAEVFNTSGTFTVPSGVTAVKVTVIGGGGNGGGANSDGCNYGRGGGGGGGGMAVEWITGLTSGGTVAVTVGGAGGTSSFGAYCSANGGSAGGTGSASNAGGGAGGTGSGGTTNFDITGGRGGSGGTDSGAGGAPGGSFASGAAPGISLLGGAAASGVGSAGTNGTAATTKGCGGSGAVSALSNPGTRNGGAGAGGMVLVEY